MDAHIYPRGCVFHSPDEIAGKKVTVMGVGLNGGGEEAIRFFLRRGARVLATDTKSQDELMPTMERLREEFAAETENRRLEFFLNSHRMTDFTGADLVIKNPGVKYAGNPFLARARVVETDLSVFLAFNTLPVIALTGSKGKSTTARAIYDGLAAAGIKAFLGGNIGKSPLTFFDSPEERTAEIIILELSSWQLADLRGRGLLKPKIALITPVFRDHMNWYNNDMEAYVADKKLIYADQDTEDYAIFSFGTENGMEWGDLFASGARAKVFRYGFSRLPENIPGVWFEGDGTYKPGRMRTCFSGDEEFVLGETRIAAKTARQGMLNACLVLSILGADVSAAARFFSGWTGLEHRLELFHTWYSPTKTAVEFYNDTAATVPEAAAGAVEAFGRPIRLLCGGTDKELDFTPLVRALSDPSIRPASTYLLDGGDRRGNNATRQKLMPLLSECGIPFRGPFDSLKLLLEELKKELSALPSSDAVERVVLSPGAASFGMFVNEFDRGRVFKETVKSVFGG